MPNWTSLGVRFLVILGLLVKCSDAQDRIIYPTSEDNTFQRNAVKNVKIPEKLLIQMKDIQNVSDFLQRFVERDPIIENDRTDLFSRRAYSAAVPTIAQPAICQPELQVVELEKPGNGAVLLWPPCVRVRRCGGCCTSKLLTCRPVATSLYNVTALQVFYNPETPNAFENQGTRVFSLEQHDRCACRCKQDSNSCGALQEFREDECRCACINQDEASQCTGTKRIWDRLDCACKCRRILDCSTGSFFNPLKCRCESLTRRSLASLAADNLNRQNTSISSRSRN